MGEYFDELIRKLEETEGNKNEPDIKIYGESLEKQSQNKKENTGGIVTRLDIETLVKRREKLEKLIEGKDALDKQISEEMDKNKKRELEQQKEILEEEIKNLKGAIIVLEERIKKSKDIV
jgi:hypothetical protein